ncbi:MAG: hypothetical protein QXS54_07785 [Candidatus Methanomethylicaceae archaeon]
MYCESSPTTFARLLVEKSLDLLEIYKLVPEGKTATAGREQCHEILDLAAALMRAALACLSGDIGLSLDTVRKAIDQFIDIIDGEVFALEKDIEEAFYASHSGQEQS